MDILCCSKEDRLSNLPPNVLDAVLVLLPIRDAVRTSILSRSWRYRWTSMPQLVFNDKCAPPVNGPRFDRLQRVDIVNQVLLCHKGPIHKFQCSKYLQSCAYIDAWIVFLSNHGIREFILHCLKGDRYEVLSRLFSCRDLRHLELTNCIVQPPSTTCCLANLTTLLLCDVTITSVALENLLSTCTFLTDLTLTDFIGLIQLKILAPNLKKISIRGSFQGLTLNTPLLASAKINLASSIEKEEVQMTEGCGCNLIKILGPLLYIQNLEVGCYFLQFLTVGRVPQMLQATYNHLKHLYIDVDFSDLNEMSATRCLIASAPYLEDIWIFSDTVKKEPDNEGFVWEARGCTLNYLNSMVMVGIRGWKNELDLLEFVLANAPVLTNMTIQFNKRVPVEELKIFKSLIQFRRASPQATIKYEDAEDK